jgi:hypothetical protein
MTTQAQDTRATGPLKLPKPPDIETARALQRLAGHTTSEAWIPEDLTVELNQLRREHIRLRRQVVAELQARSELARGFQREDDEREAALRLAARNGSPPPEDKRTSPEERAAKLAAIEQRLWATVHVLADVADTVIETLREQESDLLAALRHQLKPAEERRREAARLLAEARAEEFQLHKLGQWIQKTADDEAFGRQPAPVPGLVPPSVSSDVLKNSLERPWHNAKPWNPSKTGAAA